MRPSERDRSDCGSPKSRYGYHNYETGKFIKDDRSYTGGYFTGQCINCGHKKSCSGTPENPPDFNRKDTGVNNDDYEYALVFYSKSLEEQNSIIKEQNKQLDKEVRKILRSIDRGNG